MDKLERWDEHKEKLYDLDEVQHKFVVREYISFVLADKGEEIQPFLKKRGVWEDWKEQKDMMEPEWDKLIEISGYMFDVWDWKQYKELYINMKVDAFHNDRNQISSYKQELEEIRKQTNKNAAMLNSIQTKVEAMFNRIIGGNQ